MSIDARQPGKGAPDGAADWRARLAARFEEEDAAVQAAIGVPQTFIDQYPDSTVVKRTDPETGVGWTIDLTHRSNDGKLERVDAEPSDPSMGTLILGYTPGMTFVADGVRRRPTLDIANDAQTLFTRLFQPQSQDSSAPSTSV